MADEERLVVLFEARLADFERRMRGSVRQTQNTRKQIERESAQLAKKLESDMSKAGDGFANVFSKIRGALGIAGIGLSAGAISNLTSEWSDLNSRVVNAVGSMSRGEEVMGRLSEMARRTYSSIGQTTESFIQNSDALTDLGYNFTQQLDLTEALNNALVISATRGQQADAVMRAWSNAMALGELRGQNLNTIIQGSSRLTRALADSLGVSTNELRRMGNEGRITSQDMFNVTNQLEQLRAEADAMPATLQDSFVLLGNAVMQFVGQADQATGATGALASGIIDLADSIEEMANNIRDGETPLMQLLQNAGDLGREMGILRESSDEVTEGLAGIEAQSGRVVEAIRAYIGTFLEAQNVDILPPELRQQFEAILVHLDDTTLNAEETTAALSALGDVNPMFGSIISGLNDLIAKLNATEDAANAAASALNIPGGPTGGGAGRSGRGAAARGRVARETATSTYIAEQERVTSLTREQLTLEQAIAREKASAAAENVRISDAEAERLARLRIAQQEAGRKTGGGGRGSTRGTGGADDQKRFAEDMAKIEQRIEMMRQETALQSQLNPLIEDYGYAIEKLRIQQELENAATAAGLALTPERQAAIEALAEGYAAASVEAAQLAERQQQMQEQMREFNDMAKTTMRGFIDDMINGKSAAEALASALGNIGNRLLDMGLTSLFSGGGGLSFLSGIIPGFASGTPNTGGARGQVRGLVHGQEAVIPLPNGGRVPVEVRAPAMPTLQAANDNRPIPIEIFVSPTGEFDARVARIADGRAEVRVAQGMKTVERSFGGMLANHQARN
jgi:tape measure domain-containing protein